MPTNPLPRYPVARTENAHIDMGGVSCVDRYLWMEQETAETLAWRVAQNKLVMN